MFESLEGVDWGLLHRQKLSLLVLRERQPQESAEANALSGVIHLLDALQDDAVTLGRWSFPDEEPREGKTQATAENLWSAIAARIIYEAYPDNDLLPIEPPKPEETIGAFARRAEQAADTLFLFLCREADDEIDAAEYLSRLDRAMRDIDAVRIACRDHIGTDADNA